MFLQLLVLFVIVLIVYIGVKTHQIVNFWKRKGVIHSRPWSIFGIFWRTILGKSSFIEELQKFYAQYPEAKFLGTFQFHQPILLIRDPEIIKQVCVKNFDNFHNHTIVFTEDIDPLFGKNLFSLQDEKWRNMRAILSPAFTGSKMRAMYVLIKDCANQFSYHFLEEAKEKGVVTVEMKDIFTRYTNDVIATSAFGINCNSLKDKENVFYKTGQDVTHFTFKTVIKFMCLTFFPKITKFLGATMFSKEVSDFFSNLIKTTIDVREKNGIVRPDMIHLLMEARKGRLKHDKYHEDETGFAIVQESNIVKETNTKYQLTNDDITSQAFLFFMAGYETSATLMCFLAHELAVNVDVQQKLQEEIDKGFRKTNDDIDYETIMKMKYLDMVTSEALRKWPPGPVTERICTSNFTVTDGNVSLDIDKDQSVMMPVYALHRDQKYFPNPEKFDPERFSDENKESIVPFTYMPFGQGPRNCIGSRFALLQVKVLFVYLLRKFDIVVVDKTQIPLKLSHNLFAIQVSKGFWLGLKPRT